MPFNMVLCSELYQIINPTGRNTRKRSLRRAEKSLVIQALKIPKKNFWRIPGRIGQVGSPDKL
jgi:hypothetical protein